jgi:hypothetical protein
MLRAMDISLGKGAGGAGEWGIYFSILADLPNARGKDFSP